jgi:hypothetical protein
LGKKGGTKIRILFLAVTVLALVLATGSAMETGEFNKFEKRQPGSVDFDPVGSLTMSGIMGIPTDESEAFVSFQSKLGFDANDVLVPDTLWLLGSALIGLVCIRRKRIKR